MSEGAYRPGTKWTWLATLLVIAVAAVAIFLTGSGGEEDGELVLATTTSTYDTGLLDMLAPKFEKETGIEVKVIAVGTGQALRLGEAGDADVLLVHAPGQEIEFVEAGHGTFRWKVMYNSFLLVGPASDPAGIGGLTDAGEAMGRILDNRSAFCSRGDDSGTHSRERTLWAAAGIDYADVSDQANSDWYLSLGQGMGDTLRTASDLDAYALTDEGTFYAISTELDLEVLCQGDAALRNQYSVIPVDGGSHGRVNQKAAERFAEWIVSDEVQAVIDGYRKDGRTLFIANAKEDQG